MASQHNVITISFLFIIVLTVSARSSDQGDAKDSPSFKNHNSVINLYYSTNSSGTNSSEWYKSYSADQNQVFVNLKVDTSEIPHNFNARFSVNNHLPQHTTDIKTKSELKCEEYKRQVLHSMNSTEIAVTANIYNGTAALIHEFPHMTALGTRTENGIFSFSCGGTLIAPEWVLTAAHCTHEPNISPTHARVGLIDLKDNQQGVTATVYRTIRHPEYDKPKNDIALLKLNRSLEFNNEIRPACLYQQYDTVPIQAWVSGWGVTEFGGELSDKLQKALLKIIDNTVCENGNLKIIPSMICAEDPNENMMKDACPGDSGGPLQVKLKDDSGFIRVLGITSLGYPCETVKAPGVYTRVSHYLNWIEDIVWP